MLGNGTTTNSSIPVQVNGITSATAISASDYHTCALLSDGTMSCWGDNQTGAVGDGTVTNRVTPVAVGPLAGPVQQIAVGGYHSCALVGGALTEVECWGDPSSGELGDGRYSEPALRGLGRGGRFVTLGYAAGDIPAIPLNLVLLKGITVQGMEIRTFMIDHPDEIARDDAELRQLFADGRLRPYIGARFPLEQAAAALRYVADRKAIGKVVIDVG